MNEVGTVSDVVDWTKQVASVQTLFRPTLGVDRRTRAHAASPRPIKLS